MDVKGLHDRYQMRTAPSAPHPAGKKPAAQEEHGRAQVSGDVIELSPGAALRAQLGGAARTAAAQAADSLDARRLEALRQKYLGDACPVPARDVAAAMLGRGAGAETDGER